MQQTILRIIVILVAIPVVAVLLYAVVRIVASAWFHTKHEFTSKEEKTKGREV